MMLSIFRMALIPSLLFLASCTSNINRGNEAFIKSMNEDLRNMNNAVKMSTETQLMDLEGKQADMAMTAKAQIWLPKARLVQKLSNDMAQFLNQLQSQLKIKAKVTENTSQQFDENNRKVVVDFVKENADELYDKMTGYKRSLIEIDPMLNAEFRNGLTLFQSEFDQKANPKKSKFSEWFFEGLDAGECLSVLNHFENNVSLIAYKMIAFCNLQVGMVDGHGFYDYFSAIVGQSSTIIRKGEAIEIDAGVGAFSKAAAPKVTIDGSTVEMDEDGSFHRVLPKARVTGKHQALVVIEFINQDGKNARIERKVEYTVVD